MRFRISSLLIISFLIYTSCNSNTSEAENKIQPKTNSKAGYTEKSRSDDPAERLYIPEVIDLNNLFLPWQLKSISEGGKELMMHCEKVICLFSKNKMNTQSGIEYFFLNFQSDDSSCVANDKRSSWSMNPYMENEVLLRNFKIDGIQLTGSFKILALSESKMSLFRNGTTASFIIQE